MSEHNINQSDKNDSDKQKTERRPALVRLGKAKALLPLLGGQAPQMKPIITDVKYFNAECVNPPADVKAMDWIKSGFKGVKCD